MDKKEFIRTANGWVEDTKEYIRDVINDILDENELTVSEFSKATDIPNDELTSILLFDGDISLETLSKVLVAADLFVEIKPIEDCEDGGYDLTKTEDKEEKKQPRDSRGRFVSYDSVVKNDDKEKEDEDVDDEEEYHSNFSELTRRELVEIIEDNFLDDEVDVKNTPTHELVEFLEEKEEEGYFDEEVIDEESDLTKAIHETLMDHPERILRLISEIFLK